MEEYEEQTGPLTVQDSVWYWHEEVFCEPPRPSRGREGNCWDNDPSRSGFLQQSGVLKLAPLGIIGAPLGMLLKAPYFTAICYWGALCGLPIVLLFFRGDQPPRRRLFTNDSGGAMWQVRVEGRFRSKRLS